MAHENLALWVWFLILNGTFVDVIEWVRSGNTFSKLQQRRAL